MIPVPPRPEGLDQGSEAITANSEKADLKGEAAREERFYAMASREVAENQFVEALWTKAQALAVGDERKARDLYIELRVAQLEGEHEVAAADLLNQFRVAIISGGRFLCPYCEERTTAKPTDDGYSCESCGTELRIDPAPGIQAMPNVEQGRTRVPGRPQPKVSRRLKGHRLLVFGGLLGIVAAFFPLVWITFSGNMPKLTKELIPGIVDGRRDLTARVVDDWRGKVGLGCYVASLMLAFVLYPPKGLTVKPLCWLGVGIELVVLVLWQVIQVLDPGGVDLLGLGRLEVQVGPGAFFNVFAAVFVASGGFLKAREEELI